MATPETKLLSNEDMWAQQQHEELLHLEGAILYANASKRAHSSHEVLMSRRIRDGKLYVRRNFESFREYMDRPGSSLTYHEFNKRDPLVDDLGADTFDLLASIGLSLARQEKLIGRIRTEGDEYVVTRADGTEERFSKTDASAAKRLLPTIITEYRELEREKEAASRQLQQRDETIEKGERENEELKRKLAKALKSHGIMVPENSEAGRDVLALAAMIRRTCDSLAHASDDEKQALRDTLFDVFRNGQLDASLALGIINESEVANRPSTDDEETEDLV